MFCYKQQVLWLNYRIVIQLFVPLRVKVHEMVESVFDLDSQSDVAANDSDCSDGNVNSSVLNELLDIVTFNGTIQDSHLIDFLNAA